MATEIAKVDKEGGVSAPNLKKALETIDASAAVDNPSEETSDQPAVDGSKDGEAAELSTGANGEVVTDVQKKMKRAERFGMPVKLSEEEKRNTRAERFGSSVNSNESDAVKSSEDQKRKARAARFGISSEPMPDEEAKKKARLAKFSATSKGDNVEDDKRKARALRFSQPMKDGVPDVSVIGKPESNAAIEGNTGGSA